MKRLLSTFLLLSLSGVVTAGQSTSYELTGVITSQPQEAGTIVISDQVYKVDMDTRVHGLLPGGELGPTPIVGSEVGFNIQLRDDTHYVTDIWPLNEDEDD